MQFFRRQTLDDFAFVLCIVFTQLHLSFLCSSKTAERVGGFWRVHKTMYTWPYLILCVDSLSMDGVLSRERLEDRWDASVLGKGKPRPSYLYNKPNFGLNMRIRVLSLWTWRMVNSWHSLRNEEDSRSLASSCASLTSFSKDSTCGKQILITSLRLDFAAFSKQRWGKAWQFGCVIA